MDDQAGREDRLFERATRGDDDALEELVQVYLPRLRTFVRVRIGHDLRRRESDSDVVQSVCRELLEERDRFRYQGEAQFRSWLFTTALNKLREKHRWHHQGKRDRGREVSVADHAPPPDPTAHGLDPADAADARERASALEQAMDRLSETDREVVALSKLAGLPLVEIAARTGRSADAVRKHLGRAMLRLAALLEDVDRREDRR